MSFSSDVKDEILENIGNKTKDCCIKAEKFGEIITGISLKNELLKDYKSFLDISKLNECCIKCILKGAFLSTGCIVDPSLDYHFEIIIKNKSCAQYIYNLLSLLDFTPKLLKRKKMNSYVIYLKDSEQISIFLSIISVNRALLKFEEIRVEKEVKNNINRSVNCETANIAKTINASVKQLEAIKKIKKAGKFNNLNDKLKYIAVLREKHKNDSLEELALKTIGENKISKSGIKHRLDKIIQIANDLYN
jgi:DNA-binding protein WhiA